MSLAILALALPFVLSVATQQSVDSNSPEGVVRTLYDRVTWTPPAQPDWEQVREVFHPDAVFSLRLSREEIKVMNLDGFINEWLGFVKLEPVAKNGFSERIAKLKSTQYGDIANVWVLYEATVPGYTKRPQQGIDICHLVMRDGKWKIVSIVNEVVSKEQPLPAELAGG